MFAVKGWNVDASSLKPQTQIFKAPGKSSQDGGQKQSRKRKRGDEGDSKNGDVGQLWDEHIEGKAPSRVKKQKLTKKEKKQQKRDQESANNPNNVEVSQKRARSRADKAEESAAVGGASDATVSQEEKVVEGDKKKKRNRKKQSQHNDNEAVLSQAKTASNKTGNADALPVMRPVATGQKLTPMQAAMRQKLISARFRHLNQTLYTEPSVKALELFDQNPEMFEDYHSGFRQQVSVWPENPVDNFVATIRSRGKVRLQSQKKAFKHKKRGDNDTAQVANGSDEKSLALPRTHGTCIIADLGCGDARLAQILKDSGDGQKLQLNVLSYDLHSPSSLVTKADISNIPTAEGSVDVAIFCLALMGTNWIDFIEEACRILHWKGELWIAEIKSRFGRVGRAGKPVEHSVGGKRKHAAIKKAQEAKQREQEEVNEEQALAVEVDGVETKNEETDVSAFVEVLRRRGFLLKNGESSIDLSNKMFVKMEFIKAAAPSKGKGKPTETAQPTERFKKPKAKFLDDDKDDVATEDEAKVLKPCLYKIR